MNLSDKELKFLLRFTKYIKRIYLNYFCAGLNLCLGLSLLVVGIRFNEKGALMGAMFFACLGFSLIVVSRMYRKLFNILVKLEPTIANLDK